MKKPALTSSLLLTAANIVSACEFPPGKEPVNVFEGRETYFWIMFIGAFVLFVPIVVLYFLRNRHGLWTVIMSLSSLGLFIPAILIAGLAGGMCSNGVLPATVILAEFFLMMILFIFQLNSWIEQRKSAIKLR